MPIVAIEHIDVDENGVARIVGSRSKVIMIVMDQMNGYSPEEIQEHYPHLTMAQIHAALAYYHDRKAEIDQQIADSIREYEELRAQAGESPFAKKLREAGKLP
jgi:uncharacterized protein (DUF433 family)